MASTIRSSQGRAWFIPIPARAAELERTETMTERGHPGRNSAGGTPALRQFFRTLLAAPPRRRLWVVLALLAGYLLFCHGCHGDEDNELFVRAHHPLMIWTVAPR